MSDGHLVAKCTTKRSQKKFASQSMRSSIMTTHNFNEGYKQNSVEHKN